MASSEAGRGGARQHSGRGEMMDSVPDISLSPESPDHGLEIPLISLVGSGQQSGGHLTTQAVVEMMDSVPVTSLTTV